jgi:integrase/recombinase XerD
LVVPPRRPKEPTPFVPHIYTKEKLKRLLDGTTTYQEKWCKLEPVSLRAILLLLYGAGLRVSEAINLTCADVNLSDAILTIRLTKFYKTRHVAINSQLCRVLSDYDTNRRTKSFRREEVEALLAIPDRTTIAGQRNHALLLFLYNSGARASEAAGLCIADLDLTPTATPSVRILGKGMKERRCPLWRKTATELAQLVEGRSPRERVVLNRRGQPLTRFGIYNLLKVCVERARKCTPSLLTKRVSPHTLRHSTATHLLRAGVDLNTIRSWLGHVSLDTTQVYVEMDLEMKARALEKCDTIEFKKQTVASAEPLMDFLRAI